MDLIFISCSIHMWFDRHICSKLPLPAKYIILNMVKCVKHWFCVF